ncbi:5-formyltetrahydrofolate cyclo-ligase [Desulfovibrio sp. OttesenSCG-928-F07]|nr:5-formyltetrahydrofolate cyclo-ligase [Desulfovibrio sp. OttesenSCG-928-F07]
MQNVDIEKRKLRTELINKRKALLPTEVIELSALAQQHILKHERWIKAKSVALYVPTKNEIDTALLLKNAWEHNKIVYLPRVVQGEKGKMHFARCTGMDDLKAGAYGIMEPAPDLCQDCDFDVAAPCNAPPATGTGSLPATSGLPAVLSVPPPDFFIVPGVGFDKQGNRLGFGAGYYDRYLARCRGTSFLVAFAYAFQIQNYVPIGEWDQPVDAICTENGFLL